MNPIRWLTACAAALLLVSGAQAQNCEPSCMDPTWARGQLGPCNPSLPAAVEAPRTPYYNELPQVLYPAPALTPSSNPTLWARLFEAIAQERGDEEACDFEGTCASQERVRRSVRDRRMAAELLRLYRLFFRAGHYQAAEVVADKALQLDPANVAAEQALAVARLIGARAENSCCEEACECCASAPVAKKAAGKGCTCCDTAKARVGCGCAEACCCSRGCGCSEKACGCARSACCADECCCKEKTCGCAQQCCCVTKSKACCCAAAKGCACSAECACCKDAKGCGDSACRCNGKAACACSAGCDCCKEKQGCACADGCPCQKKRARPKTTRVRRQSRAVMVRPILPVMQMPCPPVPFAPPFPIGGPPCPPVPGMAWAVPPPVPGCCMPGACPPFAALPPVCTPMRPVNAEQLPAPRWCGPAAAEECEVGMRAANNVAPDVPPARITVGEHQVRIASAHLKASCDAMTQLPDGRVLLEGEVTVWFRVPGQPAKIVARQIIVNLRDGSYEVNPLSVLPGVLQPIGFKESFSNYAGPQATVPATGFKRGYAR